MIDIRVPATSANLGPGFDTTALALSLYNEFSVELSEHLNFINVDEKYANENNLFYKSYKITSNIYNIDNNISINFKKIDIPICRGLGSSSAMIIAGILACSHLNKLNLSNETILNIATSIEGHPDNVSPCLLGGLTISTVYNDKVISKKIKLSDSIYFTVIIPSYETSTEEARKLLPKDISLSKAIENLSHSLLLVNALENCNLDNLSLYIEDNFHVPYRKSLIKDYDNIKNLCYENGAKGFTISGSGSTMLVISDCSSFSKKIALEGDYKILDLKIDNTGATVIL